MGPRLLIAAWDETLVGGICPISPLYPSEAEIEMQRDWIAFEYYRLELVQQWPNSPYKEAALNAIRSALASLTSEPSAVAGLSASGADGNINRATTIEFPNTLRIRRERVNRAA